MENKTEKFNEIAIGYIFDQIKKQLDGFLEILKWSGMNVSAIDLSYYPDINDSLKMVLMENGRWIHESRSKYHSIMLTQDDIVYEMKKREVLRRKFK